MDTNFEVNHRDYECLDSDGVWLEQNCVDIALAHAYNKLPRSVRRSCKLFQSHVYEMIAAGFSKEEWLGDESLEGKEKLLFPCLHDHHFVMTTVNLVNKRITLRDSKKIDSSAVKELLMSGTDNRHETRWNEISKTFKTVVERDICPGLEFALVDGEVRLNNLQFNGNLRFNHTHYFVAEML